MDVSIKWNKPNGAVRAIISKSDAHRALIAAALSQEPTIFNISYLSKDIEATINCLISLGAKIIQESDTLTVFPVLNRLQSPMLDCNESGSTLRFLIPVAAVVSDSVTFKGNGRLSQRPLTPLIEEMEKNGCKFSTSSLPLSISGKLKSGKYTLPGDVSSQFISGLLFALPLLDGNSEILLTSPLQSSAYADMTIDTLNKFGIKITKTNSGFVIHGNQSYISPQKYDIEGDWSNIAPFMAVGALSGEIKAFGLDPKSKQSDIAILSVLKKFGAEIITENKAYIVRLKDKKPLSLDVSQYPDLFPVIAVLLCGANGKSVLYNAKRLRIKESDRIDSTLNLIKNLGGYAESDDDSLTIFGTGKLKGGKCDSFNDHRIVMAAAVASSISDNEVIISGAEAINKSYPTFFNDLKQNGGTINVI